MLKEIVFTLYKLEDEDKHLSVEWPVALQICQNASYYFDEYSRQ
jgi:hypothetical protein